MSEYDQVLIFFGLLIVVVLSPVTLYLKIRRNETKPMPTDIFDSPAWNAAQQEIDETIRVYKDAGWTQSQGDIFGAELTKLTKSGIVTTKIKLAIAASGDISVFVTQTDPYGYSKVVGNLAHRGPNDK